MIPKRKAGLSEGSKRCVTIIMENAKELEANDRIREQKDRRYAGKLVIEEDTIYEIDEDCMHCLEQKRKAGTVKSS